MTSERFIDELKAGKAHPAQPSMMKYYGTELNKRRYELMMAAGGSDALEWESEASSGRSEEHTSELPSLMRKSYAVFCLKQKTTHINERTRDTKPLPQ